MRAWYTGSGTASHIQRLVASALDTEVGLGTLAQTHGLYAIASSPSAKAHTSERARLMLPWAFGRLAKPIAEWWNGRLGAAPSGERGATARGGKAEAGWLALAGVRLPFTF